MVVFVGILRLKKLHKDNIFLACSAGGHLTQMLRLLPSLSGRRCILLTEDTPVTRTVSNEIIDQILYLPHGGRERMYVYPFKLLVNFFKSVYFYLLYRPKVVVSTGAHTAFPVCVIAKIFGSKIIFIETFAKIKSPSLTGRMIYRFADRFYVQWPELLDYYPKATYRGKLY